MNSIVSTVLIGIGVFVVIGTIIDTIASEKEERKNKSVAGRAGVVGVNGDKVKNETCTDSCNRNMPSFNIDGTPMLGNFDMNGNPYGITEDSDTNMFEDDDYLYWD